MEYTFFRDYKQRFESFNLRRAQREFLQELSECTTLQMLPISSCRRTIGSASKSECCRHWAIALKDTCKNELAI